MRTGRRPYTVAIASYALALMGKAKYNPTQALLSAAAPGILHTLFHVYRAENLTCKDIKLLI